MNLLHRTFHNFCQLDRTLICGTSFARYVSVPVGSCLATKEYSMSIFKMLSKSRASYVSMHYVIINKNCRFRRYTDVPGHVTLHFKFQQRIPKVQYSLSSPLLYTLGSKLCKKISSREKRGTL